MTSDQKLADAVSTGNVILQKADAFKVEPIKWLMRGWLAKGKIHILAGATGTGKTNIAMAMAATVSTGSSWPDGTLAEQGDVVIWSGEDDPTDTLVPRLMAAGANLKRIHIITGAMEDGDESSRPFDPATDMKLLHDEIAAMQPPPSLLIVDPIVSAVAGDSHKNGEVRRALQPMVDLAMVRKIAVLGITHFSKSTAGRDPVERVTGSLAFGALARIVLAAAKLGKEQGGGHILARGKSNIGNDEGGFKYELDIVEVLPGVETTRVLWGESVNGTAREILGQAEAVEDPEERSAWQEARDWLLDTLNEAPMKACDVMKAARSDGITDKCLRVAKQKLGIVSYKEKLSLHGKWFWKLPENPKMPMNKEDAQDAQKN